MTISRPRLRILAISTCTLVTSGHVASLPEAFQNQRGCTDGNRAIRDIEGGIAPVLIVKQQEINDASDDNAIEEITQRSTDDESDCRAKECRAAAFQEPQHDRA